MELERGLLQTADMKIAKRKDLFPPAVPWEDDSFTIRIVPVFFDGGWEAYTTLVYEKERVKMNHSTRQVEVRQPKLGWPGGRYERGLDRTIFEAGCREMRQETGIRYELSDLQRSLSLSFRESLPQFKVEGRPVPCHWDVLFMVFTPTPPAVVDSHRMDHDEIEDVLRRVKLSDLPYLTHKESQIARSHRRRVSKLFGKQEIRDYLEENGVAMCDIESASNI